MQQPVVTVTVTSVTVITTARAMRPVAPPVGLKSFCVGCLLDGYFGRTAWFSAAIRGANVPRPSQQPGYSREHALMGSTSAHHPGPATRRWCRSWLHSPPRSVGRGPNSRTADAAAAALGRHRSAKHPLSHVVHASHVSAHKPLHAPWCPPPTATRPMGGWGGAGAAAAAARPRRDARGPIRKPTAASQGDRAGDDRQQVVGPAVVPSYIKACVGAL